MSFIAFLLLQLFPNMDAQKAKQTIFHFPHVRWFCGHHFTPLLLEVTLVQPHFLRQNHLVRGDAYANHNYALFCSAIINSCCYAGAGPSKRFYYHITNCEDWTIYTLICHLTSHLVWYLWARHSWADTFASSTLKLDTTEFVTVSSVALGFVAFHCYWFWPLWDGPLPSNTVESDTLQSVIIKHSNILSWIRLSPLSLTPLSSLYFGCYMFICVIIETDNMEYVTLELDNIEYITHYFVNIETLTDC